MEIKRDEIAKGVGIGALFWSAVLLALIVATPYMLLVEPNTISVRNMSLDIGLGRHERVVFISDLHVDTISDEYLSRVMGTANAQDAGYVLLGGDYSTAGSQDARRLSVLSALKAKKGKYAVLGNHDYLLGEYGCASQPGNSSASEISTALSSAGFTVLRNENADLENFSLVGLDDYWACKTDYNKAMAGINRSIPILVLTHNQEAVPADEFNSLNLVLAGHTHCGGVRLPVIGSLPKLVGFRGEYDMGLHQFGNESYIYTTCGIGGGERFLAPPEVTVLDLY